MKLLKFLTFILILFSCGTSKEQDQEKEWAHKQGEREHFLEIASFEPMSALEEKLIDQGLVAIGDLDGRIIIDLKYSSKDNFFGQDVYGELSKAYLQASVGADLVIAEDILQEISPRYTLYVFDAVRPLSVQKILWNALDSIPPTQRRAYVADPKVGSIHNYGSAVDLSIYDFEKDTLLDMGTGYDHFGYLAYPRMEGKLVSEGKLSIDQLENREILRIVMKEAGFDPITSEWWHFNRYSRSQAKKLFAIVE